MQQLSAERQTQLGAWLKAEHQNYAFQIRVQLGLGAVRFASQCFLYWVLANFTHNLLISAQLTSSAQLIQFAISLAIYFTCLSIEGRYRQYFEALVIEDYHQRLVANLESSSFALVRRHSTVAWQQYFLVQIPALASYISAYQPQRLLSVCVPIFVLVLVTPVSWVVALILAMSIPLIPMFMVLLGKSTASAHRKHFLAIERLGQLFLDRLRASQVIDIFSAQTREIERMQVASQVLLQRTMQVLRLAFLNSSVLDFFSTIAVALVAVFVGFSLLGEISFGHASQPLVLAQGLFLLLISPAFFAEMKELGRLYHAKAEAVAAADELSDLLFEPLAPIDEHSDLGFSGVQLPATQISNELGQAIVRFDALEIKTGDWLRIAGESGSGKTSFIEALLGLRSLDNVEPELHAHLRSMRHRANYLGQQAIIKPGTVRQNINIHSKLDDQQIALILDKVELCSWLAQLDKGLDSEMGEHPPLSGGQAQRLALARALACEREVYIFDEPTAHLTAGQHQQLCALIFQQLKHKTVVWVSHKDIPETWFDHQWHIGANGVLQEIKDHAA
ncbi:ATP-binding cassette domain-containing protein [Alginatibacterium sediminis]|uniref:ATP-binding cassette domain-containing protein n=1 Tax=Alginatibacterium sediminis TaxID=2164068 RepID=A0A420E602_9ALTE|nr:ATP-binding cassette domain-containing protein [Alginatibacterium sediminis]RKF13292.1 ATP-binding cassette domain-containing protein [Alginatibacterium sediminis]